MRVLIHRDLMREIVTSSSTDIVQTCYEKVHCLAIEEYKVFCHLRPPPFLNRQSIAGRESAGLVWKSGTEETT